MRARPSVHAAWIAALVCVGCPPATRARDDAAASRDAASPSVDAAVRSGPLTCGRTTCDLRREGCCENVRTGDHLCVQRSALSDHVHCGKGPDWMFVIECAASSDCDKGRSCCSYAMTPHWFVNTAAPEEAAYIERGAAETMTLCDDSCPTREVCAPGGACKGYWSCEATPDSRTGGFCSGPPRVKRAPFTRPRKTATGKQCPDGYMLGTGDDYCGLLCVHSRDCDGAPCMNDNMGAVTHCQR